MLADQNHAIQLLQSNNIAVYAIYWIIAQPYFKYRKQTEIIDLVQLFLLLTHSLNSVYESKFMYPMRVILGNKILLVILLI